MYEIGPEHPLSYRQEILEPLFRTLRAHDSCAIVGSSSMGKSRLIRFLLRPDVQQHYLGEQATQTLVLLVDHNRLADVSEWGLYELLLTTMLEGISDVSDLNALRSELHEARRDVIVTQNAILARRSVELAMRRICHERAISLCFLLDEFDTSYRQLPALALANLRALRDANKYRLSYVLMLREHPERLRAPSDCEGFYELLTRCVLGLSPYTEPDARRMIGQLQARKQVDLPESVQAEFVRLSGGHPGLIVTLFDAFTHNPHNASDHTTWLDWAMAQAAVREECQRIWDGLADDERLALSCFLQGAASNTDVISVLRLKGLMYAHTEGDHIFSALFEAFIRQHDAPVQSRLQLDAQAGLVWMGELVVDNLTASEFKLLVFFYNHLGHVCSRDEILMYLYPEEMNDPEVGAQDNRIDTLVKRLREKIEPVPQKPRYLVTVRGRGYKLIDEHAHRTNH